MSYRPALTTRPHPMSHGDHKPTEPSVSSVLGSISYMLSGIIFMYTGVQMGQYRVREQRARELENSEKEARRYVNAALAFANKHGIDVPPEATSGSAANVTSSPGIGDGR